ncbi:MAG: GntR family transcriptional regulator [Chloroflexota bacterium]|nr:GntR family transcriptional regulator [Chloroflexota bacterium]
MSVQPDPTFASSTENTADSSLLLRDLAYQHIKDAIQQSDVQPGEPISETRLSSELGISRTPVREALQILAQEGLIQIIPGRAITVAAPSLRDVQDAIHVRFLLEPELARLAARNISEEQLQTLAAAQQELERAVAEQNRVTWTRVDNVWHETISAACPNKLLGDLALQIRNRVSFLSIDAQGNWDRLASCTAEHREIVEMIAAGDSEGAEEAASAHLGNYRENIFQRLSHH